jgi:hypothetical protein
MRAFTFYIVALLSTLFLATCQTAEKTDEELCDCVQYSEGGMINMKLTDECIEAFRVRFGDELIGMEEWFVRNCPAPDHIQPGEGEVITTGF